MLVLGGTNDAHSCSLFIIIISSIISSPSGQLAKRASIAAQGSFAFLISAMTCPFRSSTEAARRHVRDFFLRPWIVTDLRSGFSVNALFEMFSFWLGNRSNNLLLDLDLRLLTFSVFETITEVVLIFHDKTANSGPLK